jgi:CheY-like chemotaxis protein
MKILLTGCARETRALLQALTRAKDHEITHCADGARAIAELVKNGYDWAIIDGHSVTGREMDIARIIRTMGPDVPGHPDGSVATGAGADQPVMRTSCGVEWSKDGILQLHCGLHTLMNGAATAPPAGVGCAGEILFEYHAPCAKGRQRHG